MFALLHLPFWSWCWLNPGFHPLYWSNICYLGIWDKRLIRWWTPVTTSQKRGKLTSTVPPFINFDLQLWICCNTKTCSTTTGRFRFPNCLSDVSLHLNNKMFHLCNINLHFSGKVWRLRRSKALVQARHGMNCGRLRPIAVRVSTNSCGIHKNKPWDMVVSENG